KVGEGIEILGNELPTEDPGPVTAAERPCRPFPNHIAADMGLDLLGLHAGVVIPGPVVVAHMVQAEPIVVVQPIARLGCAIEPWLGAAGVVAELNPDGLLGACKGFALDLAMGPDHGKSMGIGGKKDKLDRRFPRGCTHPSRVPGLPCRPRPCRRGSGRSPRSASGRSSPLARTPPPRFRKRERPGTTASSSSPAASA